MMNYAYAEEKLTALLLDLSNYTADEFRRQMARIITGATGQDVPDDCHTIKVERDVLADQVRELARVLDEISSKRRAERDALAAELSKMCEFRDEVVGVMNESSGVVGWHKNHTVATWDELLPVVPDFESPQQCLREIEAKAVEKFFAHFESASFWDKTVNDVIDEGYEYAAKVRKGVNDVR